MANPGCYPTSAQLPLVPLLKAGAISHERITIDAKSGVSGAGRAAKEAFLFCEVTEGMHAYGVSHHRHMPEIEQGLADAAGQDVTVSFTPHLIPMSRGMQSTIYVEMADGQSADSLRDTLAEAYRDEYFVRCTTLSPCNEATADARQRRSSFDWGVCTRQCAAALCQQCAITAQLATLRHRQWKHKLPQYDSQWHCASYCSERNCWGAGCCPRAKYHTQGMSGGQTST